MIPLPTTSVFQILRVSCLLLALIVLSRRAWSQNPPDTVRVLREITVRAYAADRPLNEIPASVGVIDGASLSRFSNTSLLPAFNTLPGVRMEERSPGSYRFSIRGSLLRSPFGIRNVKFYWNGLPLTDGGGNTYFNLMDFSSLGNAEVIKGPAGSLYGAGTGGVVLLTSPRVDDSQAQLSLQTGSFGANRFGVSVQSKNGSAYNRVMYVHQRADGYRNQSAFRRDAFHADITLFADSRNVLSTTLFYTDLSYQTPGGLTRAQYDADPRQARPTAGPIPGAQAQKAEVRNLTTYSGLTYERTWSARWSTTAGFYASHTDFKNPSIRNFESREERNFGVRLLNTYRMDAASWTGRIAFGGEFQKLRTPVRVVNNLGGTAGTTIISDDDISSTLSMGFAQVEVDLPHQLFLTVGASLQFLQFMDERLAQNPVQTEVRNFSPELSPRLALLKKFNPVWSVFVSASRGFSPPSVAEVVPSTGIYNPGLNPETGWSYEVGIRGIWNKALSLQLAFYNFQLKNTIVIQRDASGADYFINAGNTNQNGVEAEASWVLLRSPRIPLLKCWTALTLNHYRFGNYINDGQDYSGNPLTGVAPFLAVVGIDMSTRSGLYTNITVNFVDRMSLNDAHTDFASSYFLLSARIGFRGPIRRIPFDFFIGGDNLLDQRYSLGNDLNAFGRRYFNAAPPVNYVVGIIARVSFSKSAE
ncbi:MAG: TonB-dependent receptor [Cytophagales bacterium]|nr:TonB-dependent receptor [Cytophagales bacterium]